MKVVICGGGISGLSAAYYASRLLSRYSKEPFRIILLEKSSNVGGWLKTNVKNGERKCMFCACSRLISSFSSSCHKKVTKSLCIKQSHTCLGVVFVT